MTKPVVNQLELNPVQQVNNHEESSKSLKQTWQAGTPLYQSPEQITHNTGELNEKVDVYAAGLILFEMCQKFKTQHERNEKILCLRNLRKLPKDFAEQFRVEKDLILWMTDPRPEKRPAAKEVLNSEIMKHWAVDVKYEE